MSTKILVPLDGSALSESVFPLLRLLASRLESPVKIELIRCFQPISSVYLIPDLQIPGTSYLTIEALEGLMQEYLERKKAELDGLQVTVCTVVDEAANGILAKAESCDIVLMASHGSGGLDRWLFGSIASKVTRGTPRPILVVPARASTAAGTAPAKVELIMVAIDGSEAAERALEKASHLARQMQAKLLLYQAVGQSDVLHQVIDKINHELVQNAETYMAKLAALAAGPDVVETVVRGVKGATGIVEFAQERGVDLIVMGSHGKSGLERWILGSQTERALRHAHCPVLVTH